MGIGDNVNGVLLARTKAYSASLAISHVSPPDELKGFPQAARAKPKTPRPGGGLRRRWKDDDGMIFEWDYQHGHVEVYDRHGKHLGGHDAETGAKVFEGDSARRIEP